MKHIPFRGLSVAILAPLILLVGLSFTGFLDDPTDPTVKTDILVSSAGTSAQQIDSTALFKWAGTNIMITVGPGYNDTAFFSQAGARALGDSYTCMFYIRGWTDAKRTQLMWQVPLWSGAAPFKCTQRPYSNLNKALVRTNVDSFTKVFVSNRDLISAYTAGTGTWDSTRIDLVNIRNDGYNLIQWAPYMDVVKYDSVAKCGWRHRAKVTIAQFNNPN